MKRSLLLAQTVILAVALTASPVHASKNHVETVDDILQAALDARSAGTGYDAALDEVYAAATDAQAPKACAIYADTALTGLLLIDLGDRYPDTFAIRTLFDFVMEALPVMRNDCLLAI